MRSVCSNHSLGIASSPCSAASIAPINSLKSVIGKIAFVLSTIRIRVGVGVRVKVRIRIKSESGLESGEELNSGSGS